MNVPASEIKAQLIDSLASEVDERLAAAGFKRSPKGLVYTRKLPDAVQALHTDVAIRPSYHQGAIAHVYPKVRLSMPQVCKIAEQLVAGNLFLLANAPEIMLNKPLDHLAPKAERVQWYAYGKVDFAAISSELCEMFLKWGLPFFDDYRTALGVVHGYETGDVRPRMQKNSSIFVAASYIALGQIESAAQVIENAFSTVDDRRKYAVVFSSIEGMRPSSVFDSP